MALYPRSCVKGFGNCARPRGFQGNSTKNIVLLRGEPLLAFTARAALGARQLKRVVLSTDDDEIARIGRANGLEVPFLRPPDLSRDNTPMIAVLQDVVRRLEAQGEVFDAILVLQPTTPLRRPSDIDRAVQLPEQTGADSCASRLSTWARSTRRE